MKKEKRMAMQQTVMRNELNQRMQYVAVTPLKELLKNLHTTLRGLDEEGVSISAMKYGANKVTHEKKKSFLKRLTEAFINPFTIVLFVLAIVSAC